MQEAERDLARAEAIAGEAAASAGHEQGQADYLADLRAAENNVARLKGALQVVSELGNAEPVDDEAERILAAAKTILGKLASDATRELFAELNDEIVALAQRLGITNLKSVSLDLAGKVNALNSKVDDATRNIQVQATLANADERLLPGMFASVDLVLPREDHFVMLPETAIVYNPYGNAVYVIERTKTEAGSQLLVARQHFVTLGETRGDQVAVAKGITAGDEVVTAGQLKLHNGSPVIVNNTVQPPVNPAPNLPNT